nr:MAG TPA: hypothetical protein [Caudoviricetes sp.]
MLNEKLKADIIMKAEIIAKSLDKGKDVELRKSSNGVSVAEVSKKVVVK